MLKRLLGHFVPLSALAVVTFAAIWMIIPNDSWPLDIMVSVLVVLVPVRSTEFDSEVVFEVESATVQTIAHCS